jgi:quercetin dioxygenase-like cupin family protein
MKKLSMAIAGAALSACCLGLEPAYAHPGHEEHSPSPLEQYQETPQNVLVVPPDASGRPAYYATGNLYTFLATGKETGGQFALVDGLVPPQAGAIPHVHSREDELFYILEGEITFQLGDQTVTATPGTSVYLPKGRPHGWGNAGNTQARTLALLFPAGFEGFFVDQNQPVIDRGSAPIPPARDLETVVLPLTRKYGTQVVDPAGVVRDR